MAKPIWGKEVAEAFKKELPKEFLDKWKTDSTYVFPFQKKRRFSSKDDFYTKGMIKAENAATQVLNEYWTKLVREFL